MIKIISEYPQDSRLAVISHGKMINMLFRCFMKLPVNLCCRRHFIKRSTKCETNRPVKVWIMKDWIMKDWIMKDSLKDQICYLEKQLLRPEIRKSFDELDKLLHEDFIEYGSSGRIYDKATAIASMLKEEHVFDAEIDGFEIKAFAGEIVLAMYKLRVTSHTLQRKAFSLRSSIWIFADGRWQLIFHQGTSAQESPRTERTMQEN